MKKLRDHEKYHEIKNQLALRNCALDEQMAGFSSKLQTYCIQRQEQRGPVLTSPVLKDNSIVISNLFLS